MPQSAPKKKKEAESEQIPFQIHPRAFKALGADLVTNDVVAIIELVKNAYDAYATAVDIRFGTNTERDAYIEIEDNGSGMDRRTIERAWCMVATPYRQEHPIAEGPGRKTRRVSGEKGLGRLSAARLGSVLDMWTQADGQPCWHVQVDWSDLADAASLDKCFARISRSDESPFEVSGTRIRISGLRAPWDEAMLGDLRDNLARLIPPFKAAQDFEIRLSAFDEGAGTISIQPPSFLDNPKYVIRGKVDRHGGVNYEYEYHAIRGKGRRKTSGELTWEQIRQQADTPIPESMEKPQAGPFTFEIRAWDIAPHDTAEIAERFELKKSTIRRDIRAYKGISVYRDGVLVLPKSEGARDWLGLDLRRVGKVGPRLSTPQIVGHIAISADKNPGIEDTSDRERLAARPEVTAFEEILRAVVSTLENERDKDRKSAAKEKRVVELFDQLNAKELVAGVSQVAEEGGSAADALPLVQDFSAKLDKAREEIQARFVYYSRLATVGTIAQMLVHEVRNRTTVIGSAVEALKKYLGDGKENAPLRHRVELADEAIGALEKLADTFAPLANRSFRRRMRSAAVEESVLRCLNMLAGDLKARKVRVRVPTDAVTEVAADPGELDAILLNLFSNAVYWLAQAPEDKREIEVRLSTIDEGKRIRVAVHDSGPGVREDDEERIFWPGVTNKPGGIGMGLTVASELVSEYGGNLALVKPGKLGGASFVFDLPVKGT